MKKTALITALMMGAMAAPAAGEDLREALAAAYSSNPTLEAQRAALRAIDEGLRRANAGFLPTVNGQGQYDKTDRATTRPNPVLGTDETIDADLDNQNYSVSLNQPIFRGFQTVSNRGQARAQVMAGRGQLLQTEQQVLLDAVTAYMDVLRDQAVLELNSNNVEVLERQLQASRDRFRVGEVTRTDVAQSEARLAGAVSARITAEAALEASRARYARVVGRTPGTLEPAPDLPPLPGNIDDAMVIALENNPAITTAQYNEEAADHNVDRLKGALLPTVTGFVSYSRFDGSQTFGADVQDVLVESKQYGVRFTMPLYQGGAEYADIRQAKQTRSQRRLEIVSAERATRASVRTAWENYRSTVSSIQSNESQVQANTVALDGVRQEAAVGARTTLDVLDAEQELLDSRVNLVRAQRNQYVAAFTLLQTIGRLNAAYLDLPVELYDPSIYAEAVDWKIVGWGTDVD